MNFIFPQNYNLANKLLGIIDYSTLVVNLIWCIFIFCLINILFSNNNIKILFFILLCFPVSIFSIVGLNNENIISVLLYIIKFIKSPKLYLYKKIN